MARLSRKMKTWLIGVGATIALVFLLNFFRPPSITKQDQAFLINAFQNARLVEVLPAEVESPYNPRTLTPLEKASITLSPEEADEFKAVFASRPPRSPLALTGCLFAPHHFIRLTQPDDSPVLIEACFTCASFRAGVIGAPLSWKWEQRLRRLFQKHGLTEWLGQ